MSRIIKFRGIELKSRFMVYGFYVVSNGCDSIVTNETKQKQLYIVSDTLSQYTGIKDRNGVEIYEGDIVVANLFYDVQKKELVYFKVVFDDGSYSLIDKKGVQFSLSGFNGLEVVGNIYENKELLK